MQERMTDSQYDKSEIDTIRTRARLGDLKELRCPRDSEGLLTDIMGRLIDEDEPAIGVRYGHYLDVKTVSVTCEKCGAEAARIRLVPDEEGL